MTEETPKIITAPEKSIALPWSERYYDRYYTGVGSRTTPPFILELMYRIAFVFSCKYYFLRSGGAQGADDAFEAGSGPKQIFVPWDGFQDRPMLWDIPDEAYKMAEKRYDEISRLEGIEPSLWKGMKFGVQSMHARNMQQVLGPQLDQPSEFVICWTPDGAEHHDELTRKTGGTGSAIWCASINGIDVINMAKEGWEKRLGDHLDFDFTTLKAFQ